MSKRKKLFGSDVFPRVLREAKKITTFFTQKKRYIKLHNSDRRLCGTKDSFYKDLFFFSLDIFYIEGKLRSKHFEELFPTLAWTFSN